MTYEEQFKSIRANFGKNKGYLRDPVFLACESLQEIATLFIKRLEQQTGRVNSFGRRHYNPNKNPLDLLSEFKKDLWIVNPDGTTHR